MLGIKTFIVKFQLPDSGNGYALISALDAIHALDIFKNASIAASRGATIRTIKISDYGLPGCNAEIIAESIVSGGLSAYLLALKHGYSGTEEEFSQALIKATDTYSKEEVDYLIEHSGGHGAETDPIFKSSPAYTISENDKTSWNNKSDFSGNYNDLDNKPTIPTKTSELINDSNFLTEHLDISGKLDTISDLETIRSGAALGATALLVETYKGTVTKVNNTSPDNTGNVTITIPEQVTETTVANWGFTKNTGTYSKPSGGIPASDLAETYLKLESDPVFNASAAKNITSQDITNWNNKSTFSGNYNDLANKPTIPTVTNDFTDEYKNRLDTLTDDYIRGLITNGNEEDY